MIPSCGVSAVKSRIDILTQIYRAILHWQPFASHECCLWKQHDQRCNILINTALVEAIFISITGIWGMVNLPHLAIDLKQKSTNKQSECIREVHDQYNKGEQLVIYSSIDKIFLAMLPRMTMLICGRMSNGLETIKIVKLFGT